MLINYHSGNNGDYYELSQCEHTEQRTKIFLFMYQELTRHVLKSSKLLIKIKLTVH